MIENLIESKYNFLLDTDETTLFFNSMSGSVFSLEDPLKIEGVKKGTFEGFTDQEKNELKNRGFFILPDDNELLQYEYIHNQTKYQKDVLSITWLTT